MLYVSKQSSPFIAAMTRCSRAIRGKAAISLKKTCHRLNHHFLVDQTKFMRGLQILSTKSGKNIKQEFDHLPVTFCNTKNNLICERFERA
jgi:hypothetical protein